MPRGARVMLIALAAGIASSTAAVAGETVTYTYDARGRLTKLVRDRPATGNNTNDSQVCYKLDKAENRTRVKADVNINVASPPICPS